MFETVILERENELNFIRYNELISLKFIPEHNEPLLLSHCDINEYVAANSVSVDIENEYTKVPDKYELRTIYNNYVLTKEEYEMVKKWIEKIQCTLTLNNL